MTTKTQLPMGHAGGQPPTNPLTKGLILNPAQAHPMIVRVLPNADRLYAADPRWKDAEEDQKAFAVRLLNVMLEGEYPVTEVGVDILGMFYHVIVTPKVRCGNHWGVQQDYNRSQIPSEYVEVVRPLFPEAM